MLSIKQNERKLVQFISVKYYMKNNEGNGLELGGWRLEGSKVSYFLDKLQNNVNLNY